MNLNKRSVKVIKEMQLKNGGILATEKNRAYPYVYPRDAVIMTKALNKEGLLKESEKFYYFMRKYSNLEKYEEVFQRYNTNGLPCVTREKENDNEGLVLHGIYDTYIHNKKKGFLKDMWSFVTKIAELIISHIKRGLVKTERSIHEFYELENGYEIWVNCACWRGLKDASKIAEVLDYKKESKKWRKKADKLKRNINKKLFNKKLGVYIKNKRFPDVPDISQLSPFYFGLSNSKKLLRRTMSYLRRNLWDKQIGGFIRFRKLEICKDWHWYTGGNGSWCIFTLWAAKFYKQLGDKKKEKECLNWIKGIAKKNNYLLPEHIATKEEYLEWKENEIEFNKRIINETKKIEKSLKKFKNTKIISWATPLGWSHAEYVLLK
jgi:GH15 family glucan-1,4-alpha-glucosidase